MTRAAIAANAITVTGYNVTDSADTETLATGAGNGVEFDYNAANKLLLINGTGGDAVYTIKVRQEGEYSSLSITVPDLTVTVATGKTWIVPLQAIFKQSTGKVQIDCDVAGEVLLLA